MARDIPYDPQVLRTMAGVLYERADSIQLLYGLLGFVLGLLLGVVALATVVPHDSGALSLAVVVGGALVGLLLGRSAAFMRVLLLRFQAQSALCQVEIEAHLRRLRPEDPAERADNPW